MAPHCYAVGPEDAGGPLLVWRFDSPWQRALVMRANPGLLREARSAEVSHRVQRGERLGTWHDVAPGIRAYPFGVPLRGWAYPRGLAVRLPGS